MRRIILFWICGFAAICLLYTISAVAAALLGMEQAIVQTEAHDWSGAAKTYNTILKTQPENGTVWMGLGYCYHQMGQYEDAVHAYQQAIKYGIPSHFRLACAYARLGNNDKAFENLNVVIKTGFSNTEALKEADFSSLKKDPRFQEILVDAEKNAHVCDDPVYHGLDFWIGEWNVSSGGIPAGTSSVQQTLNGCVILENWYGMSGYSGKSLNVYDAMDKQWHQHWIDSAAATIEFTGEAKEGELDYNAKVPQPDGKMQLQKMTFYKLSSNDVRQLGQQSDDGGKTWTTAYDLHYSRKRQTAQK
jgi:tetratricopeptide (TPR) repeat protein